MNDYFYYRLAVAVWKDTYRAGFALGYYVKRKFLA